MDHSPADIDVVVGSTLVLARQVAERIGAVGAVVCSVGGLPDVLADPSARSGEGLLVAVARDPHDRSVSWSALDGLNLVDAADFDVSE